MSVSPGRPRGPPHGGHALPLAEAHVVGGKRLVRIQLDEVAHEKIEKSVPVVIEECAACAPAALFLRKAGLPGNIGKGSVSVVMKQNVMPPKCAEQIVPSIVVVIANANAGLPAGASQSRLICNIGKCAVAVVLVQMSGWFFSGAQCALSRLPLVK